MGRENLLGREKRIFIGDFYNLKINNFIGDFNGGLTNFYRVVMAYFEGGFEYFCRLGEGDMGWGLNFIGDFAGNFYKRSDSVLFGNNRNHINNIFKMVIVTLLYVFRMLSH